MRPNTLLKRERELRGWSQARVADEIGTTAVNVGRWERGISTPYPHFREKLCQLFGKDARALGLLENDEITVEHSPENEDISIESSLKTAIYDPAIPLLPAAGLRLIGRDDLLSHLKRCLCARTKPLMVTLHGLPGVGKTALATTLAYDSDIRAHFCDGILWTAPGLNPDITELLSRWGREMGVTTTTAVNKLNTAEDWARAIRVAIGQRQMLVVIDDVWRVEEALAFQVGGPRCVYLVTTRYPHLAVQLAEKGAQAVPELAEADGMALLAHYAAEFVKQDPEVALTLVQSVGALPLALTLVGKYLSVQSYSGQPRRLQAAVEYLRDAQARLQLSEMRALTERHPSLTNKTSLSLQSIIAVSEQQLNEPARYALYALSLFPAKPNSFAEEAALEICQVSVETLDILCDVGLLESNGPSRYMLHQTITDYARILLDDPAVAERLVDYYVRFVEEHTNDHLYLELEISNILTALEIAFTEHLNGALVRGVYALVDFLDVRGLYNLAQKHLRRAYEAAQLLNDSQCVVRALIYLGSIEQAWGHEAQAEAFLQEGLERARKLDDEEQICELLRNLGKVEGDRGNLAQAEVHFSEGLSLARKLERQDLICRLLIGLGVVSGKRGNEDLAEAYFQEGLVIARHLGNQAWIATLLLDLGRVEHERGYYTQGELYYQECLEVTRHFGYEVLRGVTQTYLGQLTMKQGRFSESHNYLRNALSLLRRVDSHFWAGEVLIHLGQLALVEGDEQKAEAYLRESLDAAQRFEHRGNSGSSFEALGRLETRRGNYALAERYLQDALRIGRELGLIPLVCLSLYAWGELHLRCSRIEEASLTFQEMFMSVPKGQREVQALAHFGLARVAYAQGKFCVARQQAEASLALFMAIGHYRATEVERWLEKLASTRQDSA